MSELAALVVFVFSYLVLGLALLGYSLSAATGGRGKLIPVKVRAQRSPVRPGS